MSVVAGLVSWVPFPSPFNAIVVAIGAISCVVALWYLGLKITPWIQAVYTARQTAEAEQARKDAQAASQAAQNDSDRLKEIDGR